MYLSLARFLDFRQNVPTPMWRLSSWGHEVHVRQAVASLRRWQVQVPGLFELGGLRVPVGCF